MGVSPSSTEGIKPIIGQGMAHRAGNGRTARQRQGVGALR